MTINDVIIRDMAEAERAERAAEQRRIAQGEKLVGCAGVAAVALLVALGMFLAWCCVSDTPHVYPKSAPSSTQQAR
ncbi:MAG: hypothetical protein IJG70_06075 [Kiritimatiellae bacterium]|nr:hypothetical protein [Kiritimatiellia bacterium]